MTHVFTIQVSDPGVGRRLDAAARKELRGSLREAARSGCGAVLLAVDADAWAQAPVVDRITAAHVERDFHALVLSLFGLDRPVVVHVTGQVSGLGLALVKAVAELHGMTIVLANATPRGLRVAVTVPPAEGDQIPSRAAGIGS